MIERRHARRRLPLPDGGHGRRVQLSRVRGRGGAARAGGVESQAVKVSRGQARKVRVCLPSLFYFIDLLYNKLSSEVLRLTVAIARAAPIPPTNPEKTRICGALVRLSVALTAACRPCRRRHVDDDDFASACRSLRAGPQPAAAARAAAEHPDGRRVHVPASPLPA